MGTQEAVRLACLVLDKERLLALYGHAESTGYTALELQRAYDKVKLIRDTVIN